MSELLPSPIIRGEKLWLRAMERRDLDSFAFGRNDREIGYAAGYSYPTSMDDLENWYETIVKERYGKDGFYLTICLLDSDEPIGFAWLWHLDFIHSNAEFSIFISEKAKLYQGYGTDALNAVLDFGFRDLPLERIYLLVRSDNKPALRSYEKAGMVYEGSLRNAWRNDGRLVDQTVMSMLREEWEMLDRRKVLT